MARILVVEDNPLNLKLLGLYLRKAGHDVVPAVDAEEAERRLAAATPDLILMDLGLPGMDGYTFTRALRHRAATRTTPILAVTAYAMKGDRERARDAGCNDYLSKPVNGAELIASVERWLKTSGGNRNAEVGADGAERDDVRSARA